MRGRHLILLALLGLLTLAGFVIWRSFREEPGEEEAAPARTPEETSSPLEPEPPPSRRRALEVKGRAVGSFLAPLGGYTVALGDERALTDPSGVFTFPRAVRPRFMTLRLLEGEKEVAAWEEVLAGDPAPSVAGLDRDLERDSGEPAALAFSLERSLIPERPASLRWTLNVLEREGAGRVLSAREAWLLVEQVIAEEWGNGSRVRLRGRSRLPDGAHVASSLYFDGFRLLGGVEPSEVRSGAFSGAIVCPDNFQLYSATYELRTGYSAVLETPRAIEEWKQLRPEVDWETLAVPEAVMKVFVGDPAEDREEDLKAQAYYGRMIDEARRLERLLKMTLVSRTDESRVFARGLGTAGIAKQRKEDGKWFAAGYLDSGGKLDEGKWRKFVDVEWRPQVQALRDEHAARPQEKYLDAGNRLGALLKAIYDQSFVYSRFVVYPAFGLPANARDFFPDEDQAADSIRLEGLIVENFRALERYRELVK